MLGTILMDLPKAYDHLPHDLLIAKLEAYDIGKSGLNLLLNYLSNWKQCTKVNSSYSDWYEIIRGVPQGSILVHCYSIYLSMISSFFLKQQTYVILLLTIQYRCDSVLEIILEDLQHDMNILLNSFKIVSMKPNPKKFNLWFLVRAQDYLSY